MKQLIVVFVLVVLSFNVKAQNNDQFIWGEFTLEDSFGGGAFLKHSEMIYGLSYSKYIDFTFGDPEFEVDRLGFSVQRVFPLQSKKIDFTVGAGAVYIFGEQNFNESERFFGSYTDSREFNQLGASLDLKANYYITKNVGFGLGGKTVLAKDYNEILPQIRILFGNLRP